jgi:hypothetical protein
MKTRCSGVGLNPQRVSRHGSLTPPTLLLLFTLLAGVGVCLGVGSAGAPKLAGAPGSTLAEGSSPKASSVETSSPDASANEANPSGKNEPYALIFGTVWSPDDHPVYGVKVKIRRADQKKAKWELYSDHNGEFAQRVPAGKADYVVWVEAKDLKAVKLPDGKKLEPGPQVTVRITADERQDIGLHLK